MHYCTHSLFSIYYIVYRTEGVFASCLLAHHSFSFVATASLLAATIIMDWHIVYIVYW